MKRLLYLIFIVFLGSISFLSAQTEKSFFGIKAGGNLSRFSNSEQSQFEFKLGFYAGTFLNITIDETFSFQPEILFALQGSKAQSEIAILDSAGNPMPNTLPYNFEYELNEFSILIPVIFRLKLGEKFFVEAGPQLNFIIDRTITSSQYLLDGTGSELGSDSYKNFDIGFNLGLGLILTKQVNLNIRAIKGLLERDNDIKSLAISAGLEYKL